MTLGENIAQLRKAAGMTQEDLGKAVSVSTQAVSRWERGGMPDIGLLPAIADVFGVTVDTLLGHTVLNVSYLEDLIQRDILKTAPEERISRVYHLAWLMMKYAACSYCSDSDTFFNFMTSSENVERRGVEHPEKVPIVTQMSHDTGIMQAATAADYQYLLLMPEPEAGFASVMKDCEAYQQFFSFLGKPHRLEMLAFMNTVSPTEYFTAELAAQKMEIEPQLAAEILKELSGYRLVRDISVQSPEGVQHIYHATDETVLVPFLSLATELMRTQDTFCLAPFRHKPLLTAMPGEKSLSPHWTVRQKADMEFARRRGCISPTEGE